MLYPAFFLQVLFYYMLTSDSQDKEHYSAIILAESGKICVSPQTKEKEDEKP